MSSMTKYRWFFLFLIWSGVLYLTFANAQTISKIKSERAKREILLLDRDFWKRHSSKISRVLRQRNLLHQKIESLKLGLVAMNDTINSLGNRFGLSELKIEMDPKQSQGDRMPMHLSFTCHMEDGIKVLNTMQDDYPFLSIQKVNLLLEHKGNKSKFEAFLTYQYQIVSGQQMLDEQQKLEG